MDLNIIGKWYLRQLNKCFKIMRYQNEHNIKNGIKGFLFYGIPGTGKTTLAIEIANKTAMILGGVQDIDKFKDYFQILDCSHLARARYGETETLIHQVFEKAHTSKSQGIHYQILIFDDADGLFITRDFKKIDAWYIGQINVFFHELDNMDTSRVFVILTTNRIDLMDKAVIDRLYPIEFPEVPNEILVLKAEDLSNQFKMKKEHNEIIKTTIQKDNEIKTFRDVENYVISYFIEKIVEE